MSKPDPVRRLVLAAIGLVVSSCATVPAPPQPAFAPLPDASFDMAGRVSARHGDEGVAANVRWRHEGGRDELVFATPMGAALARLSGDSARVRLELADGRDVEAGDWAELTARVLGVPLPVTGLAWWIRASPHPRSAFTAEADAAGRLEVLRQDGWQAVYAYRDADVRPLRLVLTYPGVEVRLVVDEWHAR